MTYPTPACCQNRPHAEEQVAARLPVEGSGDGAMPVWNPRFAIAVIGRPDGMVVPPDRMREAATVIAVEELMGEIGQKQVGMIYTRLGRNTWAP